MKTVCPECGSEDLTLDYGIKNTSGVVQGKLTTNNVEPFFYLGCECCSETVKTIGGTDVVKILNTKAI